MPYYQLEEDQAGDILLRDDSGQEIARFSGSEAFPLALEWAEMQGMTLIANVSPLDLADYQRIYLRRRPRQLRFFRPGNFMQKSQDPPNVRRIIIPEELEEFFREIEDQPPYIDDDIVLAPKGDEPED